MGEPCGGAVARFVARVSDALYLPVIRKVVPRQTFRYAFCGGLNMALNVVLYFVFYNFVFAKANFDMGFVVISPHIAALCLVFPITFFLGFWLNRYVAFRHSPLRGRTQLLRYGLSTLGALALDYVCLKILVETLGVYPTPSQAIANIVTVCYSYLMQKYFTFRGSIS